MNKGVWSNKHLQQWGPTAEPDDNPALIMCDRVNIMLSHNSLVS